MTRLAQIGVTVGAGFIATAVALAAFGIVVKMRSTNIAPRCEARPRNVIYNPHPSHPSQNRGSPWFGWIPWVLKLTYEEMLEGIPGTGTREGGLSGSMLRVNMDYIVLLRFHSYGLRISSVAAFLYLVVLLPLYWTDGCTGEETGDLKEYCKNITDYDQTTLANVIVDPKAPVDFFGPSVRLYVVVLCSWCFTAYACYELKQEWEDILSMRRHYFLESDHWQACRHEDYKQRMEDESSHDTAPQNKNDNASYLSVLRKHRLRRTLKREKQPDYLKNREPWIPHPEMKDTPAAVALFSVLVGGIPAKPYFPGDDDHNDDIDIESNVGRNSNRDWQLNVTSAFFDHCVPNQPGFSSSVAAVTIVPNASELASAWKKWNIAALKLRRLRFIRRQVREKRASGTESGSVQKDEKNEQAIRPDHIPKLEGQTSHLSEFSPEDYKREILGSLMDEDVEEMLLEASEFGPEQTAVYTREYAQSAAPCCPNGCFEGRIENASIEELLDMEDSALEDVTAANAALVRAQLSAVISMKNVNQAKAASQMELAGNSVVKKSSDGALTPPRGKRPFKISMDLPHDLKAVKTHVIDNKTIKNLMGKDSTVPSAKKRAHRKSQSSMDDVHLPSDFELEVQLWKSGNLNPKVTSHGLPATGRARFLSADAAPNSSNTHFANGANRPILDRPEITARCSSANASYFPSSQPSANDPGGSIVKKPEKTKNAFDPTLTTSLVNNASGVEPSEGGSFSELAIVHPLKRCMSEKSDPLGASSDEAHKLAAETTILDRSASEPAHATEKLPSTIPSRRDLLKREKSVYNPSDLWDLDIIGEETNEKVVSHGNWELSSFRDFLKMLWSGIVKLFGWATRQSKGAVELVASQGTYAVVTFTSRQAAVAARQVLADGRGSDRFNQFASLPIPPLADAAPGNLLDIRGCCRPVTMTINKTQKKWRFIVSIVTLAAIYFFYTIPLTAAASYANSENLTSLFPGLLDSETVTPDLLSSLFGALIWSLFFSACPIMLRTISNFGSNATSNVEAEFWATKAFWWFMLVSAFSGTSLQTLILQGFNEGIRIGNELESILRGIAAAIPSQISATWINWIIVKTAVTSPLMYLLQLNTYLLDWTGLKCCARAARGGGPGAPVPFRVYVDSGVVLLCVHALACASPLVAFFSFLYFLFWIPMLRRNVIFVYRPKFDGGGIRWPFLFDMSISSMFAGQILLAFMMGLKAHLGPSLMAAMAFVPTYFFRDAMRAKYLQAFNDVGLLQSSLLDGWDTNEPESSGVREARRRFLVDAHKAAYVPVCIAGTSANERLTAEPAVVIPTLAETEQEIMEADNKDPTSMYTATSPRQLFERETSYGNINQFGATMRRATTTVYRPTTPTTGCARKNLSKEFDETNKEK